ncbi:Cytochrome C oxidase subunit II, transmembrane domain-containing protein [Strongyloides ratti]|uniref:Cytochrome C oxidase subunit II, transmembrane domain-containing protein n=1 Tax=Strongyloides ratti TaxID=34506 RepID=A0A090MVM3_STRRB|nr:Cytochrome C oxidase subunit II, transmembrane domain-containing protein [Strongyloides ratti]CEF62993.1 Cytochrome C oxidase subunit II, transmembrane domain-containing protein [Strongyloides ratti]
MSFSSFEIYKKISLDRYKPPMTNIYMDDIIFHSPQKNSQYFHHLRTYPALSELPGNYIMQNNPLHYSRIQLRDVLFFIAILISLFIVLLMLALILMYKKYRRYRNILPPSNESNFFSKLQNKVKYFKLKEENSSIGDDKYGVLV